MNSNMRRPSSHYRRISALGVKARLENKKPRNMVNWILERCERLKNGCWKWSRYIHPTGYGFTSINGRGSVGAHTLSFETFNGPIPSGVCVLHKCDNRKCVNPDHLFLGTRADNNFNRDTKLRQAIGSRIHTTKLTAMQVTEIRHRFSTGETKKALGREFGVTGKNVESIVKRQTWKHI